jgi:hypothetical protein
MSDDSSAYPRRWAWPLALLGLGVFVFAATALSGPGRIDVVDGQTRFEVGRSLVEHGDSALRDPRIWWGSFPGRGGQNFTYYRFPQTVLAAGAIVVADATGPVAEGRRHFFFVWTSAFAAALLAIAYAIAFRRLGCRPTAAVLWALGGIFCTPAWIYATSTYDDILGTAAVVGAAAVALAARVRFPWTGAAVSGLLMGLAFNCKQPLGAFAVVIVAILDDPAKSRGRRLGMAAIVFAGLAAGIAVEKIYDHAKFPFDKQTVHAEQLKLYRDVYTTDPFPALVCLSASPGCGFLWYCPPVLLGLCGMVEMWRRGERRVPAAVLLASLIFIGFHCFVTFFKGDPAWGPRYLTPWYGLLWLFAPAGAALLRRRLVGALLTAGVVVQVLALAVDPHRLLIERSLPSAFGASLPWLYFRPEIAQLVQRPREIVEIARDGGRAEEYSPAPSPTFAFPVIDPPYLPETGRPVVERYAVLRGFRPWWASMRFLPPSERTVALAPTAGCLLVAATFGVVVVVLGIGLGRTTGRTT